MKYVTVPEPIILVDRTGTPVKGRDGVQIPPIDLHAFLMDVVCASSSIGTGPTGLRRVAKLDRLFGDAKPGDIVGIEDADYTVVMEVVNSCSWAAPVIAKQQMPLIEALEHARTERLKAVDDGANPA